MYSRSKITYRIFSPQLSSAHFHCCRVRFLGICRISLSTNPNGQPSPGSNPLATSDSIPRHGHVSVCFCGTVGQCSDWSFVLPAYREIWLPCYRCPFPPRLWLPSSPPRASAPCRLSNSLLLRPQPLYLWHQRQRFSPVAASTALTNNSWFGYCSAERTAKAMAAAYTVDDALYMPHEPSHRVVILSIT